VAGLELYQDIHVALRSKIIPQNGAKKSESPDVVTVAEIRDHVGIDRNPHGVIVPSASGHP
jgi:hypothetical protein